MKQYIDKADIEEEINRRLEALANTSAENNREFAAIIGAQHYELINLAQYINTLEIKEIDSNNDNSNNDNLNNDNSNNDINNDVQLTWEDIRELYIIFAEVDAEIEFCKTDIKAETIGYYQEVLKRFMKCFKKLKENKS